MESLQEADLATVKPSSERGALDDDIIIAAAARALVSAAKGKRLKAVDIHTYLEHALWKPFALPAMLPAWVAIDDWGGEVEPDYVEWNYRGSSMWTLAARMLRVALCHTSRLPLSERQPALDPANSRLLTSGDTQEMHERFDEEGLPCFNASDRDEEDSDSEEEEPLPLVPRSPFECYFRWLRDDAELAQRVTDAWNVVVQKGGADLIKCYCSECDA